MIPEPSPPFEFSIMEKAKQSIRRILARATTIGLRAEIERRLKHIDIELKYHPRTWGDPVRNLRGLQQVQYRGWISPLIAYYSAHERVPFVVLGDVVVEPDDPLAKGH